VRFSRKKLLFFSPVLLLSLLFVSRIAVFIPLLNKIYPDIYMLFFLFFSIYFFLKINVSSFSPIFLKFIFVALILISLLSVTVSEIHTPKFVPYTQLELDTLDLLPLVEDSYVIPYSISETSHPPMYYSYSAVYYDLSTPSGANNFGTATEDYIEEVRGFNKYIQSKNCQALIDNMITLNVTDIIVYNEDCEFLRECGLFEVKTNNNVCLYNLPS